MNTETLLRGRVLSCSGISPPQNEDDLLYLEDAVVLIKDGIVELVERAEVYAKKGGDLERCDDVRDGIIMPGLIDAHIHFTQMDIVASHGHQLLQWLEDYAFPAEARYVDAEYAASQAKIFLDRLFSHGTTTAVVFTSVHPSSADAFFKEADRVGACMVSGKVMMDRHAPDVLLDETIGDTETAELIERWHGQGRLAYAVTPRFALTSTPEQLAAAGELLSRYPGVYLHTHLAENLDEVKEAERLFPDARSYADVYAKFGLLNERSIFAHGIHLSDEDLKALSDAGSTIAFCPTSNLFLGSGLLDLERLRSHNVPLSVATDIGAGTSYSMLATLADGYKVTQLLSQPWHPLAAFYAATLGNAIALRLDHRIGKIAPGYDADLVVLRPDNQNLLRDRIPHARTLTEELFALIMLGDDRVVARTYVAGNLVHSLENTH